MFRTLIILLLILPFALHARGFIFGNDSMDFPAKLFIAHKAPTGFRFIFDGKIFYGSGVSSDGTSIPDITMNGFGAGATLGYRLSLFMIGAQYEYMKWYQFTDPTEVKNFNIQGAMTNISPMAGLDLFYWSLLFKYHLKSQYSFEQKNADGQEYQYTSPESSYSLAFYYRFTPTIHMLLEYMSMTYSKVSSEGTADRDIRDSESIKFSSYIFGLGFSF